MRYPTQRLYDRSAERNVGHEVPVHHIHVNAAGPGLLCLSDLFTQPSEVGSEYRRSQLNPLFYHFRVFPFYFHDVAHGCPTGCPPCRGSEFSALFTISRASLKIASLMVVPSPLTKSPAENANPGSYRCDLPIAGARDHANPT